MAKTVTPANPISASDAATPQDSLTDLADNIECVHHGWLKRMLPRLSALLAVECAKQAAAHPELLELRRCFANFRSELLQHMAKEELVLFPWCRQLDGDASLPPFPRGCVRSPIHAMNREHHAQMQDLAQMRALTSNFAVPEGASPGYAQLMEGLAELEADLELHNYKEHTLLFPRAIEAEARLAHPSEMDTP